MLCAALGVLTTDARTTFRSGTDVSAQPARKPAGVRILARR
jgi:hypothetical protein